MCLKTVFFSSAFLLAGVMAATSSELFEPERGTHMRRELLDAVRAEAETVYGPQVEFIVGRLRVSKPLAYASLVAQRPGGQPIDLRATPGYAHDASFRDQLEAEVGSLTDVEAVLRHTGSNWIVIEFMLGTTEAWMLGACDEYGALFPEFC